MCFDNQAIDYYKKKDNSQHYFAAANTSGGFVSFFSELFNPKVLRKIYILKGGPGVGKSTLMKKVASVAQEKNLSPVCYHCSSDPHSLDGVIIREKSVCVLDGTPPHITDPSVAGIKEIIINMGSAWNTHKLSLSEKTVLSLTREKSSCYSMAYKYLAAEKELCDSLWDINYDCIIKDKLFVATNRLCTRALKKGTKSNVSTRLLTANSCLGQARLYTFEKMAKQIYFVRDIRNVSRLFFSELFERAKRIGTDMYVSYDCVDIQRINGIFFPNERVSVTLYSESLATHLDRLGVLYKVINMRRFCDGEGYSKRRTYYRFGEKCRAEMHECALDYLMRAGVCHAQLEEIYKDATDYGKVGSLSDKVIADIFN